MFDVIHRVISESAEIGNQPSGAVCQSPSVVSAAATAAEGHCMEKNTTLSPGPMLAADATLMESEKGLTNRRVDNPNNPLVVDTTDSPMDVLHSTMIQPNSRTANSSLSDMSYAAAGHDDDNATTTTIPPGECDTARRQDLKENVLVMSSELEGRLHHLQRMDSTADSTNGSQCASSSQNSSPYDWYVYLATDIDGGGGGVNNPIQEKRTVAATNKHHKPNMGLIPHQLQLQQQPSSSGGQVRELLRVKELDASTMAVTAPPYVLEESLSSQLLWKDTAGQRPPQPVEDRAFFEKMWAQNFAYSKVNYHMPVEVLTATSPIYLSPFADGDFEEIQGNTGLVNYNIPSVTVPQDAAKTNVAEAALVSRMNEGECQRGQDIVVNKKVRGPGSDGDLTVLVRGDNVFGATVSKSFARPSEKGGPIVGVDTVNISVASYRVVQSKKHGKYAQYLVIYREGSIRDTVGVWKRYREFEALARIVTQCNDGCAAVIANISPLTVISSATTSEPETEHLPNAITSWRLLKKRQRWFRCLDAGYLSLKVFLLERFLHDILFESSSPKLLREFVVGAS